MYQDTYTDKVERFVKKVEKHVHFLLLFLLDLYFTFFSSHCDYLSLQQPGVARDGASITKHVVQSR